MSHSIAVVPDAPAGGRHRVLAQIPNAISLARLAATPIVLVMVLGDERRMFTGLLLGCLLSDILDGVIARGFELTSPIGARLDSIADLATCVATVVGLFAFQRDFIHAHSVALLTVVIAYAAADLGALWRFGRLASLHTYSSRAAAYAQGILVMTLFLFGFNRWLLAAMVTISVAAYCEELAILAWALPDWRADVRGLYWLVRERQHLHEGTMPVTGECK
jgi:CDP-diacylglycerol--glycerol-3-phosphate 3-phosphatidyltransferase